MRPLNKAFIASLIGTRGQGFVILAALHRRNIGAVFEAGIAFVVLAIAADCLSQSFA